jgi:hypothetical protein
MYFDNVEWKINLHKLINNCILTCDYNKLGILLTCDWGVIVCALNNGFSNWGMKFNHPTWPHMIFGGEFTNDLD